MIEEKSKADFSNVEEVQYVLMSSKFMKTIYSQFSDRSNAINELEQPLKTFSEQKTAIVNENVDFINNLEMLAVQNLKFKSYPVHVKPE